MTSPIRADLVPTASWTNAAVAAGGVAPLASGLIAQQAGTLRGQAEAGGYLGADKIARSTFFSSVESTYKNLQLSDPQTAAMVGTVAGQTTVGGAEGRIKRAQRWGKTLRELALEETLGYGYFDTVHKGQAHTSMRMPDERVRVIDVNTSLISGHLKAAQSQTKERVFSKIKEALDKKDFTQAWELFKKYEHVISREKAEQLKQLGEKIWGLGTEGSTESKTGQDKIKETSKTVSVSLAGGAMTPAVSPVHVGMTAGTKIERKETDRNTRSNVESDQTNLERQFKYLLAGALTETGLEKDTNTRGNMFKDVFSEVHTFQEAMKLAEQYKELATLENSLSINTLPLLVQHRGDKLLTEHPDKYTLHGLNNAYDEAIRQLIEDIYSGDPQRIESVLKELETIQSKYAPSFKNNFIEKGEQLKKTVEEKIKEQEQMLNEEKQNILDRILWPAISPHVPGARALVNEMKKFPGILTELELQTPEGKHFGEKS